MTNMVGRAPGEVFTDYYSWRTDSARSTPSESRVVGDGRLEVFAITPPELVGDRTPGRTAVRGERLSIYARSFADGMGEDHLHAHDDEACWVVLEGEAVFRDDRGNETRLLPLQGVHIPVGASYAYTCTGDKTTVMRIASRESAPS